MLKTLGLSALGVAFYVASLYFIYDKGGDERELKLQLEQYQALEDLREKHAEERKREEQEYLAEVAKLETDLAAERANVKETVRTVIKEVPSVLPENTADCSLAPEYRRLQSLAAGTHRNRSGSELSGEADTGAVPG